MTLGFQAIAMNSLDIDEYTGFGRLTSGRMPIVNFFAPRGSGIVDNVTLLCYTNGSPAAKFVDVNLWWAGEGNPFTHPSTANSWSLISTGQLDVTSVTATQLSSADYVNIPMSATYIDAAGVQSSDIKNRNEHVAYAFSYALTFDRTGTNSDDDQTNVVRYPNVNSIEQGLGLFQPGSGNTGQQRFFTNKKWNEQPFSITGTIEVSTIYGDAPIETWLSGVTAMATPRALTPSNFFRRSGEFTAIGSFVTRAVADLVWYGNDKIKVIGKIWDDSGGEPNTVVACGHVTIETQGGGNFFSGGSPIGQSVPTMFVFSTPVTSGNVYHFSVECDSYNFSADVRDVSWLAGVDGNGGLNAADSRSGDIWAGRNSTTNFFFEVWYTDSETAAIWASMAPNVGSGAVIRTFPTGNDRTFPTWLLREKHTP
jgi:hypothetical protein